MKRYVLLLSISFMALQSADILDEKSKTRDDFPEYIQQCTAYGLAGFGVGALVRSLYEFVPQKVAFVTAGIGVYVGWNVAKDKISKQQNLRKQSKRILNLEKEQQELAVKNQELDKTNQQLISINRELSQAINNGISGLKEEIGASSNRTVIGLAELWLQGIENARVMLGGQFVLLEAVSSGFVNRDAAIQGHKKRLDELNSAQQNARALLNQEAFLREDNALGFFGIGRISEGSSQSANRLDYNINEVD